MEWADYDEKSKTIMIDKNMVYINGEKLIQEPKTPSGERVIVLNRQAVCDLEMLRAQFKKQTDDIDAHEDAELRAAELNYTGNQAGLDKRSASRPKDGRRRCTV